jgi:hypothetical protein
MASLEQASQLDNQVHGPDNGNFLIGLTLQPDPLDVDHVLASHDNGLELVNWSPTSNANGVRLWAKHFAPLTYVGGIQVLRSLSDFFTINLLNPSRFGWAKSILESNGWKMIIIDKTSEARIVFSIPQIVSEATRFQSIILYLRARFAFVAPLNLQLY